MAVELKLIKPQELNRAIKRQRTIVGRIVREMDDRFEASTRKAALGR